MRQTVTADECVTFFTITSHRAGGLPTPLCLANRADTYAVNQIWETVSRAGFSVSRSAQAVTTSVFTGVPTVRTD